MSLWRSRMSALPDVQYDGNVRVFGRVPPPLGHYRTFSSAATSPMCLPADRLGACHAQLPCGLVVSRVRSAHVPLFAARAALAPTRSMSHYRPHVFSSQVRIERATWRGISW